MIQTATKEIIAKDGCEKIVIRTPQDFDNKERALVATTTGEPFMPARLYFKFLKKKTLIKALDKRNCIDWNDENNFTIHYWEEAKNMGLSVPYDEVPEDLFPVLLAHGRIVDPSDVYVDVRSFNRAIGILKFFNKYIGPEVIYATHIATYNRYISSQEDVFQDILNLDLDELFSEENLSALTPKMMWETQGAPQDEDDDKALQKQWEEELRQPIPVIRKISVKNSKPGLAQLHLSLTLTQVFAKEYWEGNNSFNPSDLIEMLASRFREGRARTIPV